ncbi:unnamed protein product [Ixodes pacificus]
MPPACIPRNCKKHLKATNHWVPEAQGTPMYKVYHPSTGFLAGSAMYLKKTKSIRMPASFTSRTPLPVYTRQGYGVKPSVSCANLAQFFFSVECRFFRTSKCPCEMAALQLSGGGMKKMSHTGLVVQWPIRVFTVSGI